MFSACDETNTDLLTNLAEGKMVVVVNDGQEVILNICTGMNYGQSMKGEVFINAYKDSTTQTPNVNIMYGDYNNDVTFTARTYSTAIEADKINFMSSYGNTDDENPVTIEITELTENGIKGKFTGKVKAEGTGTVVNIKGAFWAKKMIHPM